jgi:hypothetical protein
MYADSPKLAAARCLDTIAGSRALMLGAWSTDDLTVRGDAIARELRELAKQLRQEALEDESSEAFNIIPYPVPPEVPEYAERPWWN